MNLPQELLLLGAAVIVLIVAVLIIQHRQRADRKAEAMESPFATSTEGTKLCPNCGMFNLSMARE